MAFDLACPADLSVLRIEGADAEVLWSEVVDHVGGVDKDGGGTEPVSTFVTEVIEDGVYTILKNVQFGDAVNSLTFKSLNEMVYFDDGKFPVIKSLATLQLGQLQGDWGINGSVWSFGQTGNEDMISAGQTTAKFYCYASMLKGRTAFITGWNDGNLDIRNSVLIGAKDVGSQSYYFGSAIQDLKLNKVYFAHVGMLYLLITPSICNDVHIHHAVNGLVTTAGIVMNQPLFTSIDNEDIANYTAVTIIMKDAQTNLGTPLIMNSAGIVIEQYTCNIHVTGKDGANLSGVTVTCKDKDDNQVFSVQTDDRGDIAEQIADYKKWEGTSETLTEYSPHKFILTKAGQRTITISDITVGHPIVWEIVMSGANRVLVGGTT